jgi:hypothetical protein
MTVYTKIFTGPIYPGTRLQPQPLRLPADAQLIRLSHPWGEAEALFLPA